MLKIEPHKVHHYNLIKKRWTDCQQCPLHKGRQQVVHVRGQIPADFLFVGEAPGPTEDFLGFPFIGPSGHVLNRIIEDANIKSYAIANVVGCFPKSGKSFRKPKKVEIDACNPRLQSLLKLVNPSVIIGVGKVASLGIVPDCSIVHPSAMLRGKPFQYVVHFKRSVHRLKLCLNQENGNGPLQTDSAIVHSQNGGSVQNGSD